MADPLYRDEAIDDADATRRAIRLAAFVVLAIVVAGLAAIPLANAPNYRVYSLFYEQFATTEAIPLLLAGTMAISLVVVSRRATTPTSALPNAFAPARWMYGALAALVFVIVATGVRWVFHGYAFVDDEYSALFQATMFAHGKSSVSVPQPWCSMIGPITPSSIAGIGCVWTLSFLPLHSLFRAPFVALGVDGIAGALTAAVSLLLVASIARKLWPDRPRRAWLAALFFASSTQVLFMSMTFFSMPTHLLFSLVWLWLYVDDRPWSLALLPWVGFAAMGVHSPFPHGYFALVFLFRYVRQRRWVVCLYVGAVYVFALLFWLGYLNRGVTQSAPALATVGATAGVAKSLFALPSPEIQLATVLHLSLLVTWSTPIVPLLVSVAAIRWKQLDAFTRDAVLGIIFILLARTFLSHTPQGAGWGYRFIHDAMGTIALVAAVGADELAAIIGARTFDRALAVSFAATVLFQLPWRAENVHRFVDPYRRISEWMSTRKADVVVIPTETINWGRQLVRNDPFLRARPVLFDGADRSPATLDSIRAKGLTVEVVSEAELRAAGVPLHNFRMGHLEFTR